MIHSLLEWQIKKTAGKTALRKDDPIAPLIIQAYQEYEDSLRRQQHALNIMSEELNALNNDLRRRSDEQLAESDRRFKMAAEGASDGIWDWNVSENSLWLSPRCQEMLGKKSASLTGCIDDWYAYITPKDRNRAHAFIKSCLDSRKQQSITLAFEHEDGQTRHCICRAAVSTDSKGNIVRVIGTHTDVTDMVRINEELHNAKAIAEAANTAKSDFLANMSHELRTPLNSIIGMSHLLMSSKLPAEQKVLVDSVYKGSCSLLEIVNDILDLSKIEAGEVTLETIGFDISYVLDSVIITLEQLSLEKEISLVGRYNPTAFPYVIGDPLRLSRILMNLISNAIKYTEKGQIEVHAETITNKHGETILRCEVRDTGVGIPKDKIDRIFDKFTQADTSTTRRYGGTGLGLAITRELVELMGGDIGVTSKEGEGSTFWFTIPFAITQEITNLSDKKKRTKNSYNNIPAESARLLIAEDHPMNQILISRVLETFGITDFDIVESGRAVLKRTEMEKWDMVLMDCHMPEMSGYDATREIRQRERGSKAHIPIIAMTANAMSGEREKCLRFGMDDYISKPIDVDELKDTLAQWLTFSTPQIKEETQHPSPEQNASTAPVDLSVLLDFTADDTEMQRELINAFLAQSEKNIKSLQSCLSFPAHHAWGEAAHMLKGGASSIGASLLSTLAAQAQDAPNETDVKSILLKKIEDEYVQVEKELRDFAASITESTPNKDFQ